jgi:hypothetical protein
MAPAGVTEGRIIHYVPRDEELEDHRRPCEGSPRDHVAGVIVKVWDRERGYINATIFPDGSNTGLKHDPGALMAWRTSISYDANGAPGTWHFPEPI